MRKIMLFLVIALNVIIIFYSCKKDKALEQTEPEQTEYDTNTSQDNSLAEGIFNDVNNIANEAIDNGGTGLSTYKIGSSQISLLSTCAAVTVNPDSSGTGGNIDVNFGTTNCQCLDGRFRRGIIHISYTGAYRDSGTQLVTTFNDYYVGKDVSNMFQVNGTKTVKNNGRNASGHLNFSIVVSGQLTNSAGVTMQWSSTRNREWIAGDTTAAFFDDEYVITGSSNGSNFEGNSFTVTITNGLHFKLNCNWITEGTFELTPANLPTRTFDYGHTGCDNKATVTVNGQTFPIVLR